VCARREAIGQHIALTERWEPIGNSPWYEKPVPSKVRRELSKVRKKEISGPAGQLLKMVTMNHRNGGSKGKRVRIKSLKISLFDEL